jgi:hypothetical protein
LHRTVDSSLNEQLGRSGACREAHIHKTARVTGASVNVADKS